MAQLTSVLIRVACEARALVHERRSGVAAVLEERQRRVRAGQLIMATAAIVGGVTGSALREIEASILAVQVVLPPDCV